MLKRITAGIGATALLCALLIGVPIGLIIFAGNPIPTDMSVFFRPDSGGRLLVGTFIPLIAWAAWATYAVIFILDATDAIRHRPVTHRVTSPLGSAHKANRALISAVIGLIAFSGATTAHAAIPAAVTEITISQDHSSATKTTGEQSTATPEAEPNQPNLPTITTADGDSLWGLAEQHLGDGKRYIEILELNLGIIQPDGGALGEDGWLNPGWELKLPADATNNETPDAITVEAGDTLTELAEEHLGDGNRWNDIAELNDLADPNIINEGQTLQLPTDKTNSPNAETNHAPVSEPETNQAPAPTPVTEHVPATPSADPAPQPDTHADATNTDTDEAFPIVTAGGIGSILAAGILGVLGIRRVKQRRNRKPGQRIVMPDSPELTNLELELRTVETPHTVDHVDQALRHLARWAQDTNNTLPQLYAIRLDEDEIALYLETPAQLPTPFVAATDDQMAWIVNPENFDELDQIPSAPYPALVSLGHDAGQAQLLVDLEHLGALNIQADEGLAHEALTALAVELATNQWAEDLQITLVGLAPGLAEMIGSSRVRHINDVDTLITNLIGQAQATRDALDTINAESIEHARSQRPDADSWAPEIVILGTELTETQHESLAELVTQIPRLGIAAVAKGHLAGEWTFNIRSSNDAELQLPANAGALPLVPQLINQQEYDQVAQLLLTTEQEPITPEPAETPTSATTTTGPETELTEPETAAGTSTTPDSYDWARVLAETLPDISTKPWNTNTKPENVTPLTHDPDAAAILAQLQHRPWVQLFGNPILHNARGPEPLTQKTDKVNNGLKRRATELIAFLALHPGTTTAELHDAIWPGKHPSGKTAASSRNKLTSQSRSWLGNTPDGTPYVPRFSGTYELHEDVTTDWQILQELIGDDLQKTSTAALTAALDLITAQPISNVTRGRYLWAINLREDMIATATDVCHELATRALEISDFRLARRAATIGRQIDPINEISWRDALRIELATSSPERFNDLVTALTDTLNDFEEGYEPEPETQAIINEAEKLRIHA